MRVGWAQNQTDREQDRAEDRERDRPARVAWDLLFRHEVDSDPVTDLYSLRAEMLGSSLPEGPGRRRVWRGLRQRS